MRNERRGCVEKRWTLPAGDVLRDSFSQSCFLSFPSLSPRDQFLAVLCLQFSCFMRGTNLGKICLSAAWLAARSREQEWKCKMWASHVPHAAGEPIDFGSKGRVQPLPWPHLSLDVRLLRTAGGERVQDLIDQTIGWSKRDPRSVEVAERCHCVQTAPHRVKGVRMRTDWDTQHLVGRSSQRRPSYLLAHRQATAHPHPCPQTNSDTIGVLSKNRMFQPVWGYLPRLKVLYWEKAAWGPVHLLSTHLQSTSHTMDEDGSSVPFTLVQLFCFSHLSFELIIVWIFS